MARLHSAATAIAQGLTPLAEQGRSRRPHVRRASQRPPPHPQQRNSAAPALKAWRGVARAATTRELPSAFHTC
eukprot:3056550-Prymnesium_polylepis.2